MIVRVVYFNLRNFYSSEIAFEYILSRVSSVWS